MIQELKKFSAADKAKLRGFIFDMDGTIFDTERLYRKCWYELQSERGYIITDAMLDRMRGASLQNGARIFEGVNPQYSYLEERGYRMDRVFKYIDRDGVPLKPGLKELFSYLKEHNYRRALGTSTIQTQVDRYLAKAGMAEDFDFLGYGNLVEHGKPAPDLFLLCADRIGLKPSECAVVEDSINGITSAHAAGMTVIGIHDMNDLSPVRPLIDLEIDRLDEIAAWLM